MAYTAQQFEAAAINALAQFPLVAQLVRAGDPRVLAQLRAQAAMLAMLSEQVDVAQYEPFLKAFDATVLSDAALKGLLPLARPASVQIRIDNTGYQAFTLTQGRRIVDPAGRVYVVEAAATVPPNFYGFVTASQRSERVITHTVAESAPFYLVEVGQTEDDVFMCALSVWRTAPGAAAEFAYAPEWCNVAASDLSYQVEVDELRRMWVQFGSTGVVGYQPAPGDVLELRVSECGGKVDDLTIGAVFGLEYVYTAGDAAVKLSLIAVDDTGAEPPSVADMRVMSRYPSIYSHSAVYLGEFGLLLRRYITGARFLSVWNEQIEEAARGPNLASVNTLFVSGLITGMSDSAFQTAATTLIGRADSSYRIQFVPAAVTPVPITITASISVVHDAAAVEAQIRAALLSEFGDGAPAVSEGMRSPIRTQAVTALLKDRIPALADGRADFSVAITMPAPLLPEMFLQVTDLSTTVSISYASHSTGLWAV